MTRELTEHMPDTISLEMVKIPGGTFLMGSPKGEEGRFADEGPQHKVIVPAFLMGKYPVTQSQYEAVMGTNPAANHYAKRFVAPDKPVVGVSWHDAVAFCAALSQYLGHLYRLPSEAEWEYACRARTTTPFYFGETITTGLVSYCSKETTTVGSFLPNAFGLYDMHGNVWEWCQDTWHDSYEDAPTDGTAWIEEYVSSRVLRGGCWGNDPEFCRSSIRDGYSPDFRDDDVGLRVACDIAYQA